MWQSVVDSELVAALIGAFTGLGGYFLGALLQRRALAREVASRHASLLLAAFTELGVQIGRLSELRAHLVDVRSDIESGGSKVRIPSTPILPGFLGTLRDQVLGFQPRHDILTELGRCHFELCHVEARLDVLRERLREFKGGVSMTLIANVSGLSLLVAQCLQQCKATHDLLRDDASRT